MRRAFLPILPLAMLLLLTGTWLAWQHRFEIDPAHPHLTLRDLQRGLPLAPGATWQTDASGAPELVLDVGTSGQPVLQVLPLPLSEPVRFLMFDFAVQPHYLKAGTMPWADGRLMIEWNSADGSMEPQYLVSARGNNPAGTPCVVACPARGLAVPVLRVEHLGSSGSFRLRHCRIDVVRESVWWTTGRWLLLGGWFAWAAALAGWGRTSGLGRPMLAAAVWVFCASQWAVPGPWQSIRPLASVFEIPEPASRAAPVAAPLPPTPRPAAPQPVLESAPPVQSLGELPFGGSLLLEIKERIKQARPLFHVLLFFGPALVFAFLVGRWKSIIFAASLAGAIEWSQYLFGFGFDSSDWFDLSCDALGVAFALWMHARVSRWWLARKAASEPVAGEASASQPT